MTNLKNSLRKYPVLFKAAKKIKQIISISGTKSEIRKLSNSLDELRDLFLYEQTRISQQTHPNPLNAFGGKGFSQTDEDGITIEIIKRLKLESGTFAEFGVGNGLENNTLILAAMNWRGFWVGGEDLAFATKSSAKFCYLKSWITLNNIIELTQLGMSKLNMTNLDVISLDLDGNDIYFAKEILKNKICPKLFIVEYNAQFPPPAKFQIEYSADHIWVGDNYFGAALQNFYDLFLSNGYKLICCNSHTGANAFFVKNSYAHLFPEVPNDISRIFVYPRYFLYKRYGHLQSLKVVQSILND